MSGELGRGLSFSLGGGGGRRENLRNDLGEEMPDGKGRVSKGSERLS